MEKISLKAFRSLLQQQENRAAKRNSLSLSLLNLWDWRDGDEMSKTDGFVCKGFFCNEALAADFPVLQLSFVDRWGAQLLGVDGKALSHFLFCFPMTAEPSAAQPWVRGLSHGGIHWGQQSCYLHHLGVCGLQGATWWCEDWKDVGVDPSECAVFQNSVFIFYYYVLQ